MALLYSFRSSLLVTNSLNFLSYANMLTSLFPKVIFTRYRIQGWILFFQHLRNTVPLSLVSIVPDEKSAVTWIVFPLQVRCDFSQTAFKIFNLSLVLRSSIMLFLAMDFFGFFLLGVHSASWTCSFMYLGKFERFQPLFFEYFSFSPFSYSSPQNSMTWILHLFLLSHKSLKLSNLFSIFSSCF